MFNRYRFGLVGLTIEIDNKNSSVERKTIDGECINNAGGDLTCWSKTVSFGQRKWKSWN